jgi:transposase InsO family protein
MLEGSGISPFSQRGLDEAFGFAVGLRGVSPAAAMKSLVRRFAPAFWRAIGPMALLLADGLSCGLHRIERLMRHQALKARPRRRRLPPDLGERQAGAVAANVLDRSFEAAAPNRKWIADFTYVWTAEG